MAGESSSSSERKLDQTPTWALAGVCAVMIIISIALEKTLHKLGTWFRERHKKALFEALEKVKSELMVLGFISLLLTFGQKYIAKICIPTKVANHMLPCPATETNSTEGGHQRRLLWYQHLILAADSYIFQCEDGKVPLISFEGMAQLHILIFFLAVFHVLYSAVTMTLGRLKIRGWKQWEQETLSPSYEFSYDPSRFRLTKQTFFVRRHISFWTRILFFFYVGCFFRQFFKSVSKSDYMTLRNGFISVHLAAGSKFDFQKYIKRSLDDDFKTVVGVRIGALFFCSYITLPLYALIAQMGSHMKKSIFDEQTSKALKKWHMAVKNKHGKGGKSPTQTLGGGSSTTASMNSTLHSSRATLHRFKTTGHSTRSFTHDDHETSDFEADPSTANLIVTDDDHDDSEVETSAPHVGDESRNEDNFSFVKPAMMK
ncbi:hypothetical protein ACSBR2_024601 [Camellia fascicularis]